jgi:hypothetical protein
MIENELEASRTTETSLNVRRIEEIEKWFRIEYPARLLKAERYYYLGIPAEETRLDVEKEAYDKERDIVNEKKYFCIAILRKRGRFHHEPGLSDKCQKVGCV